MHGPPLQITPVHILPGPSSCTYGCAYIFYKMRSHHTHFSTICFLQSLIFIWEGQAGPGLRRGTWFAHGGSRHYPVPSPSCDAEIFKKIFFFFWWWGGSKGDVNLEMSEVKQGFRILNISPITELQ